jgi:epoxide hydrolase-like predicted phosphatase
VERITSGAMEVRPEMLGLVGELRTGGIATGIVTNNVRALAGWRELADWEAFFDVVVDSCEVGMRKPEPRIYLHACACLGVEPSAAVFVDDMQANVDGAIAVGMRSVLMQEPSIAIEEIRRLVG